MTKHLWTTVALSGLMTCAATAGFAEELDLLIDNNPVTQAAYEALTKAYTEKHPDVTFSIELRPVGSEGDNIVKTRLATGEMADVFTYNSGSLLASLRPSRTLVPINDLPNLDNVNDAFLSTVTDAEGNYYGVPYEAAMGGGIFYHIPTYEKLGLKVPTTWDELMANSAVIAEKTDQAPIIQTYGDSWTSQLPVLANNFNVLAENPDFAEEYTNNAAKFATTPAALEGFERLQDIAASGYLNEDFGAATLEDGMQMVATGKGVHYPMLTFALGTVKQNNPDELNDIGFFAQPGDDAEKNGLTIWMSQAVYIPKTSDKVEAAKGFVDFMATEEACELIVATNGATGPYLIDGCDLPADVPTAVADMLPYFEKANGTAPALEYLSPIKGPALQQLTVEVGSGIRDAKSAAELYDKDVAKQARQLGLPNW